jgi:CRISPR system Cascade subunit CasC
MIIELHLLQNFAPANLNRDDTGSPKDCEFGGHRRGRISSQCLKRSVRNAFADEALLDESHRSVRTKRLVEHVTQALVAKGKDAAVAAKVVAAALGGIGIGLDKDGKTQYLLFLGNNEIKQFTGLCLEHWDVLASGMSTDEGDEPKAKAKDAKKAAKESIPKDVAKRFQEVLNGGRAADLALFGRMLADLPHHNVPAASQVAHAISTNRLSQEFDFYTAVDDLKSDDTTGADMIGTVEFNSCCFYRYANVDLGQLTHNLDGDPDLARQALAAFIRAAVRAVPTGKQNSMAAQNPPSLVFAVVRERSAWSLANAFLKPVRPDRDDDLISRSTAAMDEYWAQLVGMYGGEGIKAKALCALTDTGLSNLKKDRVDTIDALVNKVLEAVS